MKMKSSNKDVDIYSANTCVTIISAKPENPHEEKRQTIPLFLDFFSNGSLLHVAFHEPLCFIFAFETSNEN